MTSLQSGVDREGDREVPRGGQSKVTEGLTPFLLLMTHTSQQSQLPELRHS